MAERITKAQILREARRVYGRARDPELYETDAGSMAFTERRCVCEVHCEVQYGLATVVLAAGTSRAESRRMTMAALKAARDAR